MTASRGAKPIKRERQRITRTACEPCREKRAKCDGEKPCGRCQTRSLDCHFTQRAWTSKRSLQDEAASLRKQLRRRDCLLDAICTSGDDVVKVLRDGGVSYDEAYEKLRETDAGLVTLDVKMGSSVCETEWSPPPVNSSLLSSTSSQSSCSFKHSAIGDNSLPRPCINTQQQQPQQSNPLQQQMDPIQSISWAAPDSTSDTNSLSSSLSNILDSTPLVQPLLSGIAGDCPTVFDPMLWPPINSSDPLGQPLLNSWTGLMTDPTDRRNSGISFPCTT